MRTNLKKRHRGEDIWCSLWCTTKKICQNLQKHRTLENFKRGTEFGAVWGFCCTFLMTFCSIRGSVAPHIISAPLHPLEVDSGRGCSILEWRFCTFRSGLLSCFLFTCIYFILFCRWLWKKLYFGIQLRIYLHVVSCYNLVKGERPHILIKQTPLNSEDDLNHSLKLLFYLIFSRFVVDPTSFHINNYTVCILCGI